MVNEHTRLQHAVDEALLAADAARRAREEFLSRMSHELRTPLNAVIGFSRMLESNKAGNQRPEDIDMLKRVRAGGEQLLRLIENVLDQSDAQQGHLEVARERVDVSTLAERVMDQHRAAASAKGLRMVGVLPPVSPTIELDARRFEQVLGHLIDNAIKFTDQGSVRVVMVLDAATNYPTTLTVSDTGMGIAADRMEQLFTPFEQGDNSRRRVHGGSGLGLPLARRLCHAMGCQLVVESQVGRGSRFSIRFPRSA
jgi:two-component system, sensor histidine kinase